MKTKLLATLALASSMFLVACGQEEVKQAANAAQEKAAAATQAVKETTQKATEAAKDAAGAAADKAKEAADAAKEATKDAANKAKETAEKAVEATKEAAKDAADKAKETAEKAVEAAKETAEKAKDAVADKATAAAQATKDAAANAVEAAKDAAGAAADKAKAATEATKDAAANAVEAAKDAAEKAKDAAADKAKAATEATKDAAANAVEAAKDTAANLVDKAKETAANAVDSVKDAASSAKETVANAVEATKDAAANAVEAAKETTAAVVDKAKETATNAVDAVKDAASSAKDTAANAVEATKDAAANAVEAVKDAAGAAVDKAKDAVSAVKDTAAAVGEKAQAAATSLVGAAKQAVGLQANKVLSYQEAKAAGEKLADKQELVFNAVFPTSSFDVNLADNADASTALSPVMDTLVREGLNGELVGAGAESWSVSEDGLTWTFKLRKNAKWHNGDPVVAGDYVYSWRRLMDPKTAASYQAYLAQGNVVNAAEIVKGTKPVEELGVKAVDDYTLEVKLTTPTPWFDQMVTYVVLAPLNKKFMDEYGDKLAQAIQAGKFVGNGPFRLTKVAINDYTEYEKNNDYWDADNIALTKIRHIYVSDFVNSYYRYLNHELLQTLIDRTLLEKLKQERPEEVKRTHPLSNFYISFDTKAIPLPVRQAVSLLTQQSIITNSLLKRNVPTTSFAPTNVEEGQKQVEAEWHTWTQAQRQEKAREILEKAGYNKNNAFELEFAYIKTSSNELLANALEQWINKGSNGAIHFKRKIADSKTFFTDKQAGLYPMSISGWTADYNQASTFFNVLRCNDPSNDTKWCSPEYTQLLDHAVAERSSEKRAEYYAQANKLIQDQAPVVPLFFVEGYILQSPALGGFNPLNQTRYLRDLYVLDNAGAKRN